MNQLNCVIVTICCCLGVTEKGQGVFVSQSETKWDESTCTLVQPDIICYDDGFCVVVNGFDFLNNINVPDNGIWIGFTKTWISYAYVGCNKVNAEVEYSVPSLGECRRRTGCQTFGIRNSTDGLRCKCASNSQVHSGTCGRKCEETDQYPCGDITDTTMFSIYTVEKVPPSSHSQNKTKNCLLFYYRYGGKGHDFFWESCNFVSTPALLCSDTNFLDSKDGEELEELTESYTCTLSNLILPKRRLWHYNKILYKPVGGFYDNCFWKPTKMDDEGEYNRKNNLNIWQTVYEILKYIIIIIDQNQMAQTKQEFYQEWAMAVDNCFVGKHFPATIQSVTNALFAYVNSRDFWTGIIKKESIISSTDMLDISTNQPVTYSYVEQINQTVYVRFAKEGESRKSLCAGGKDRTPATPSKTTREAQPTYSGSTTTTVLPATDRTSETPTITTPSSTSRVTSTIPLTPSVSDKTSDTPPTMKATTTTISYPVPEGKHQGGSTAGLAAGISISLALLFIVTIIVLLFLKKRGLLPKLCKRNADKNNTTADTATEVSFVSTSICESTTNTMQDLTVSNHSYFVLEKTFEVTNKEEIDHYAEPDITNDHHHDLTKTSHKDSDNNYDTIEGKTASAKSGLTKLNYNYNKVTLHQTSEYDHIHLNGSPTKYDRHTENEYDISNNVIDGKRDKGYDDDDSGTYNHLSEQDLKSSGKGEVYGMPNTHGDSGYDTSGALKHIRNTASKDQQPEYAVIKKKW